MVKFQIYLTSAINAFPVAYYFLDDWLSNFYYRTNLSLWVFIVSGILGIIIAMLTISYESFKAAMANPANALKVE